LMNHYFYHQHLQNFLHSTPFAKPLWGSVRIWEQCLAKLYHFLLLTLWHFSILFLTLAVNPIRSTRTPLWIENRLDNVVNLLIK
jgi:hypothetical protein